MEELELLALVVFLTKDKERSLRRRSFLRQANLRVRNLLSDEDSQKAVSIIKNLRPGRVLRDF